MARAKRAAGRPKAATRRRSPAASRATLRLYRHGVGDCHLLSIPRGRGKPFHMMIDCGLLLGGDRSKLRAVVEDIIKVTDGRVDVLAVTHEHWDHVSGFVECRDLFAVPGKDDARGRLSVDSVWMAWTEDPDAADAQAWERERKEKKRKLVAAASKARRLAADGSPDITGLAGILSFLGVTPEELESPFAAAQGGGTEAAFEIARSLAGKKQVYCRPAEWVPFSPEDLPQVRIYALGPPDTYEEIRRLIRASEVYALDQAMRAEGLPGRDRPGDETDHVRQQEASLALIEDAVFGAAGMSPTLETAEAAGRSDPCMPFDATYHFKLSRLLAPVQPDGGDAEEAQVRRFLAEHYMDVDPTLPRQFDGWRRIDTDWLLAARLFGLQLDNATNNTSLALAVEFGATGPVLLFAADAQVGNWLSWHGRTWDDVPDEDGKERRVTGEDLIRRTTFYKVGHHGSHNATLRQKGVELMDDDNLVAFIPVDQAHARRQGWNHMPLPSLVKALEGRSASRVLRSDREPTAKVRDAFAQGTFRLKVDPLYFELSFEVPA